MTDKKRDRYVMEPGEMRPERHIEIVVMPRVFESFLIEAADLRKDSFRRDEKHPIEDNDPTEIPVGRIPFLVLPTVWESRGSLRGSLVWGEYLRVEARPAHSIPVDIPPAIREHVFRTGNPQESHGPFLEDRIEDCIRPVFARSQLDIIVHENDPLIGRPAGPLVVRESHRRAITDHDDFIIGPTDFADR
jgi:hypothetical protein